MLVEPMESTVDSEQWKLELERVLPSLKIRYRYDNRVEENDIKINII